MKAHRIKNTVSGLVLGVWFGCDDDAAALDAMARDAGYENHAAACEVAPVTDGELRVDEALVLVALVKGGDAQDADSALVMDLDRGNVSDHEWAVLVTLKSLRAFLTNTRAHLISAEPWNGGRFGDGTGGTVELGDEGLVTTGCYRAEKILQQLFE